MNIEGTVCVTELLEDDSLDQKTVEKIINTYEGRTIYLSKQKMKKHYQKKVFLDLKRMKLRKPQIVAQLRSLYDISRPQAYNLVKEFEDGRDKKTK